MTSANSWARPWIACEKRLRASTRSSGVQVRHSPLKAATELATARSMSAGPQSGTDPMTSSVAGLMTWMRSAAAAVTCSLSMKMVL